ncbi:hypothetical protein DFJ73DRAFT_867859 [Zopfochytrium polystomum]|nr:hypothetical protein DFJ73DRAFT_867859 [Zopfochytrium polystomum]
MSSTAFGSPLASPITAVSPSLLSPPSAAWQGVTGRSATPTSPVTVSSTATSSSAATSSATLIASSPPPLAPPPSIPLDGVPTAAGGGAATGFGLSRVSDAYDALYGALLTMGWLILSIVLFLGYSMTFAVVSLVVGDMLSLYFANLAMIWCFPTLVGLVIFTIIFTRAVRQLLTSLDSSGQG